MAWYNSAIHAAGKVIAPAAKATGAAFSALPGNAGSGVGQRLSTIGSSIANPNITYAGPLNPFTDSFKNSGGANWYNAPSGGGGGGNNGGGGQSYDYADYAGGGGTNPNAGYDMGGLQNTARDRINAILGAYNSMNGLYDQQLQDQTNQFNKQYDTQLQGLNDQYGQSQNQLSGIYGAHGLSDSSYYGNAQDEAKNTYNTNLGSINDARSNTLAGLGRSGASAHAGINSGIANYNSILGNLGQYSGQDLTSLLPQLQTGLADVQNQNAGLGTNQSFINQLQQYAPQANQGASQLQAQLDALVKKGYPSSAKSQIATGLIGSAQPADPAYYQDYFQKLLSGAGA